MLLSISSASKIVGFSPPRIRPLTGGSPDLQMLQAAQAGMGSIIGLQVAQVPHFGDFTLQLLCLQVVSQPAGKS
jgi:hypothetical protein